MLGFIWVSDKQWIIFKYISCNILGIRILQDYLLFTWNSTLHWAFCTSFVNLCLLPDMSVPLSMFGGCFCLSSFSYWDLLISLIGQNEQLFLCHVWLTRMTGFHFGFHYLDPRAKSSLPFTLPRESPWEGLLIGQRLGTLPLSYCPLQTSSILTTEWVGW